MTQEQQIKYWQYYEQRLIAVIREDRQRALSQRDTGAKQNKEFYTGMVAAYDSCIESVCIVLDGLSEAKLKTDNCPACGSVGMWTDTKNEWIKMCLACGLTIKKRACSECGRILEKALDGDLVCPVHG